MPQSTTPKTQPWKSQWPAKSTVGTETAASGTAHGFEKGKQMVMDGNTNGNTLPKAGKKSENDE